MAHMGVGDQAGFGPTVAFEGHEFDKTDVHGNVVVPEDRVRAALEDAHDPWAMRESLHLALGKAWDDELEPFRYAGAGAPVRWLHRVG